MSKNWFKSIEWREENEEKEKRKGKKSKLWEGTSQQRVKFPVEWKKRPRACRAVAWKALALSKTNILTWLVAATGGITVLGSEENDVKQAQGVCISMRQSDCG